MGETGQLRIKLIPFSYWGHGYTPFVTSGIVLNSMKREVLCKLPDPPTMSLVQCSQEPLGGGSEEWQSHRKPGACVHTETPEPHPQHRKKWVLAASAYWGWASLLLQLVSPISYCTGSSFSLTPFNTSFGFYQDGNNKIRQEKRNMERREEGKEERTKDKTKGGEVGEG